MPFFVLQVYIYIYIYKISIFSPIKSLRHIRPCINKKQQLYFLSEFIENNIVEEGGSIKGLLFSEVFMALMIFIKLYFRSEMET